MTDVSNVKEIRTVEPYPKEDFVLAYTDGPSNDTIANGGSGSAGYSDYPDVTAYQPKILAGTIASNFTCELLAIEAELDLNKSLPVAEQANALVAFCYTDCSSDNTITNGGSGSGGNSVYHGCHCLST